MLRVNFLQLLASLTASIVLVSDGMQYGWSSPVIPLLRSEESPVKISTTDETWLETLYLIGGPVGIPIIIYLTHILGRHKIILIASAIALVAWIIIALATRVEYLYAARFLMALSSSFIFVAGPMYISEIADQETRGFLTGLVYIMLMAGLLTIYSVAPFTPLYVPSIVGGGLLALQIITFSFMPESPYYLVAKGKYEAAKTSLRKFKAKEDCDSELIELTKAIAKKEGKGRIIDLFLVKSHRKAFTIGSTLIVFQHSCALSVVLMNLHTILTEAGSGDYFQPNVVGIVFAVLMLSSVIVCSFFVDKLGRRVLLIFSCTLTGLCLLGLAVYFNLKSLGVDMQSVSWFPVGCVMIYPLVYNVGLGVVPKIMCSELFPTTIKPIGMSFCDGIYTISGSLSLILYKYLAQWYGTHVPFYIFAGMSYLAAVFAVFVVPETKGKSLAEIQVMLET